MVVYKRWSAAEAGRAGGDLNMTEQTAQKRETRHGYAGGSRRWWWLAGVLGCVGVWVLFATGSAFASGDANHPNVGECSPQAEESPGFATLPDCRRYELVTPAGKNGALIGAVFNGVVPPQIAADGQRVIAQSIQCIADTPACHASGSKSEGEPYEFERTTRAWVTHPLAPAAASFERNAWRSVSAEAATALFFVPSAPGGIAEYLYARSEGATPGESVFRAIGPFAEPALAISEHGKLDEVEPLGVLATADLSHVVYEPRAAEWSFDHVAENYPKPGEADTLYEYAGTGNTAPLLVNVRGGAGSHELISVCGAQLGAGANGERQQKLYGAMSEDGRVVFFTTLGRDGSQCEEHASAAEAPAARELFARVDGEEAGAARSVLISSPTAGVCSGVCAVNASSEVDARDAVFSGASVDGSRVFFLDTQQLTNGASESGASAFGGCNGLGGPGGCNLYESVCEGCQGVSAGEEEKRRELVDVSAGATGPEGPRVQGVMAISSDGSHVYFVARGVLTGEEENLHGEKAEGEAENLYDYSGGHVVFVARMAPADEAEWLGGNLIANVPPDGAYLVLTSHRALTAGDTRVEGEAAAQVFEYDAATRAMTRVSIGEDGFDENGNGGTGNATIVGPEHDVVAESVPMRSDPSMSDDGQFVFFESPIGLTAGAVSDVRDGSAGHKPGEGLVQNVYEFYDGHVYLISDGKDVSGQGRLVVSPVELLGADVSGANVFFATYDSLVPEDTDTLRDYYDAHACSEGEPCAAPVAEAPACGVGSCQAAPGPAAVFGAPASSVFSGAGNTPPAPPPVVVVPAKSLTRAQRLVAALKACRRDHQKKKRVSCEKQARKKYGPAAKKTAVERGRSDTGVAR
jgi:hypothetical protein